MFKVYVLADESGHLYKGFTNDLVRRLKEHKCGKTRTTAKMTNLRVVYTEVYNSFAEARAREVYLKTAAGRKFLKSKILRS